MSMKVCRYRAAGGAIHAGLVTDDEQHVRELSAAGVRHLHEVLEADDPVAFVRSLPIAQLPTHPIASVTLLAPVDRQEVWAAGVTYLRSKVARMEESDFSATAYDRVYDAPRPEIFFKSTPDKVVGPGDAVGIRRDATWSVPEPELVLVMNSRGGIAGCSIGNDMSSRDIEGENLLYLPQAKVYARSCAIGPWLSLGSSESDARGWTIRIAIRRAGREAFAGETSVAQIKRGFDELAAYLFRSQVFAHGAMLLTGTGIVPPDSFTLEEGDVVEIQISGIGTLVNPVTAV
jgi:2-dehydro-3-deoxy-D-arabinonate dehydratase